MKFLETLGHLFHNHTHLDQLPLDADFGHGRHSSAGALSHEERALIARSMLRTLQRTWASDAQSCPQGLLGITVASTGIVQLMNLVPGLRTLDPEQMNASDLSRLLEYLSANEPAVYEQTAAMLTWHKPSLRPVLAETAPLDVVNN